MTEKENMLRVYRHEKAEWTPIIYDCVQQIGYWSANECGLRGERVRENVALDCFGVEWDLGHGAPVPVPGKYLLDDICDWREVVKFPDVKSWDWEGMARVELANYEPDRVLTYFDEQGCFDRLTQLMGFENALMALILEPDECKAFFEAVADYKIDVIDCVAKYMKPDVFCYTDDLAKADGLFMSPATYRELIKPAHARIIKAIRDRGMIAEQHTCGKCQDIIPDYVEIGIQCFFPAQASNDLVDIQKKYGDKLVIYGGFDSQGAPGLPDADEETIRAEARRCVETYAVNGGYICLPMIVGEVSSMTALELDRQKWFYDEFKKTCAKYGV